MPAYMIALAKMHDTGWVEDYLRDVPAIITSFGGEYVAVGQAPVVLEGVIPAPDAMTVIRFPDMAILTAFLESEAYRPYRERRMAASEIQILAFEAE